MKYAHYFKRGTNHSVIISDSPRPAGTAIRVNGKKEARKVAADNNAKPWNF